MLYGRPGDNRRKELAIRRLRNYFRYNFNERITEAYAISFFRRAQGNVRYVDWSLAVEQSYNFPQYREHWMDRDDPPPPEFGRRDDD